jgi:hypothetical protein
MGWIKSSYVVQAIPELLGLIDPPYFSRVAGMTSAFPGLQSSLNACKGIQEKSYLLEWEKQDKVRGILILNLFLGLLISLKSNCSACQKMPYGGGVIVL